MSQSIRRALYRAKGLPDPGPTPSVAQIQLTILVERPMVKVIDDLYEFVTKHFPSRNDFLVTLLQDGLSGALQAKVEAEDAALRAQAADSAPSIEVDRPALEIVNPGVDPVEGAKISARLRALRGDGGGPSAVERPRG